MGMWAWRIGVGLTAIPIAISWASCGLTKMFYPVVFLGVCFATAAVDTNILAYYLCSLAPYAIAQTVMDDMDDLAIITTVALIEIATVAFALGVWFALYGGCGIGRSIC